jgi:hypothetical protein
MSPSLPMIGVVIDALRRKAVSIQPTALSEAWKDCWNSARAGTTSD